MHWDNVIICKVCGMRISKNRLGRHIRMDRHNYRKLDKMTIEMRRDRK